MIVTRTIYLEVWLCRLQEAYWRFGRACYLQVKVKVTLRLTVSQPVSHGVGPIWSSWPDIYYCLTVTVLFLWGALSDERTGLSFVSTAGPCQRSLSRVRVLWDSRPYFSVSHLRLPFSSPPTTRRVTVEVFDPAPTQEWLMISQLASFYPC
jgi:hypothetical protein